MTAKLDSGPNRREWSDRVLSLQPQSLFLGSRAETDLPLGLGWLPSLSLRAMPSLD
jgi:hypothetical protein